MEMNAWWIVKKLAYRIDGASVFSDYILCLRQKNLVAHFSSIASALSSFRMRQKALKRKHKIFLHHENNEIYRRTLQSW